MRSFLRFITATVTTLDSILFFLSVFFVPLILLVYGISAKPRIPPWYSFFPLVVGIFSIVLHFTFLALKGREQLRSLWFELTFVFQARSAWTIGSSLACCAIGIYFLFSSDSNLASRYEASLGLYTGLVATTLAIHAFYKQTAPITNVETLLEALVYDLNHRCPDGSRLWLVYPALNIGYYRTLRELGMSRENDERRVPEDHIYDEFRRTLFARADRLGNKAMSLVYPIALYETMFKRYEETNRGGPINQERVLACVEEASKFALRLNALEIPPDAFPQHIIIISDVVYTVMSYGLPVYHPNPQRPDSPAQNQWYGKFEGGEGRPATLLIYRREDASLARLISEHLELLVKQRTKSSP